MATFLLMHGERAVRVATPTAVLEGRIGVPEHARGLVIVASAAARSRYAKGNDRIAVRLRERGFAVLVINLLTAAESTEDSESSDVRFHLPLLATRLSGVAQWAALHPTLRDLPVAYLAGGVSAAAAFEAAAEAPHLTRAVVTRCGRPELAGASLRDVHAAALLVVRESDVANVATNQRAVERLPRSARMHVIPDGAECLADDSSLDVFAQLAASWCDRALPNIQVSDPVPLRMAAQV